MAEKLTAPGTRRLTLRIERPRPLEDNMTSQTHYTPEHERTRALTGAFHDVGAWISGIGPASGSPGSPSGAPLWPASLRDCSTGTGGSVSQDKGLHPHLVYRDSEVRLSLSQNSDCIRVLLRKTDPPDPSAKLEEQPQLVGSGSPGEPPTIQVSHPKSSCSTEAP